MYNDIENTGSNERYEEEEYFDCCSCGAYGQLRDAFQVSPDLWITNDDMYLCPECGEQL